jgi:soluble lytic murein transglycosylase-like protein
MTWLWILAATSAMAQTPEPPAKPPPVTAAPKPADLMRTSIAMQLAAVRRQAESVGAWMPPEAPEEEVAPAACAPLAEAALGPLIQGAATAQNLEATLLRAVIEQESGFRPCAVSPKGARGLMQLMPQTAAQFAVHDVFDPKENVLAGSRYLKLLVDRYKGDLKLALGAYNAGPALVDQTLRVPNITETRDYVDSIMKKVAK